MVLSLCQFTVWRCVSLCNHERLPVFSRVLSRFVHSVPHKLSHSRPEWADKMREEEKVRKRWKITLNSGSRSANVQKKTNAHAQADVNS